MNAARQLAETLHAHNIVLVYGGGTTGLMGELARTLVRLYGEEGPKRVHGIIPRSYLSIERPEDAVGSDDDAGQRGWLGKLMGVIGRKNQSTTASALLSEAVYGRTTIVADVQIRKKVMCKEVATGGPGSGFIGLSGGFGTMDELMEMVTWNQLAVHDKGVCLLNIDGYWDNITGWLETAIKAGFVRGEAREMFTKRDTPEECVQWLQEYRKKPWGNC